MNYNLLYAISILVFVILLYHYLNNVKEGIENKNDDSDWKETINAWTISFKRLLKKIQDDKELIQRLNNDCQKYQEIYDCLEYRQKENHHRGARRGFVFLKHTTFIFVQ